MGAVGEALDVRVGESTVKITEEPIVKDHIATTPRQQCWHGEGFDSRRYPGEGRKGRVRWAQGNIGNEIGHGPASARPPVGRAQGLAVLTSRHQCGALDETQGPLTDEWCGPSSDSNQRGNLDTLGLRRGGVGQDEIRDGELWRGTHGHRPTPIVRGEREGSVNFLTAELDQLSNSLGEHPGSTPLGVPHARLINSHDPPLR